MRIEKIVKPLRFERFIFENDKAFCHGFWGYKAYNQIGENVGIVFPTEERYASRGNCELAFYEEFYSSYGVWHRIKSLGKGIPFATVEQHLKTHGVYFCLVDPWRRKVY